jgi:hypothetical protein
MKILREAEQIDNHATARKFDVSESLFETGNKNIFLRKVVVISGFFVDKSNIFRGRRKHSSYLNERWQFGYVVSSKICQLMPLEIVKEMEPRASTQTKVHFQFLSHNSLMAKMFQELCVLIEVNILCFFPFTLFTSVFISFKLAILGSSSA